MGGGRGGTKSMLALLFPSKLSTSQHYPRRSSPHSLWVRPPAQQRVAGLPVSGRTGVATVQFIRAAAGAGARGRESGAAAQARPRRAVVCAARHEAEQSAHVGAVIVVIVIVSVSIAAGQQAVSQLPPRRRHVDSARRTHERPPPTLPTLARSQRPVHQDDGARGDGGRDDQPLAVAGGADGDGPGSGGGELWGTREGIGRRALSPLFAPRCAIPSTSIVFDGRHKLLQPHLGVI